MVRYCVMWKFKSSDDKTPKELAEEVKENMSLSWDLCRDC